MFLMFALVASDNQEIVFRYIQISETKKIDFKFSLHLFELGELETIKNQIKLIYTYSIYYHNTLLKSNSIYTYCIILISTTLQTYYIYSSTSIEQQTIDIATSTQGQGLQTSTPETGPPEPAILSEKGTIVYINRILLLVFNSYVQLRCIEVNSFD